MTINETTLAIIVGVITICAGLASALKAVMGITQRAALKDHATSKEAPTFIIVVNTITSIVLIAMGVALLNEYDAFAFLHG